MANRKLNILIHRYETPTRYIDGDLFGDQVVEWRVSLRRADDGFPSNSGREFADKHAALVYADGIAMALSTVDCLGTVVTELVTRVRGRESYRYVYEPIEL
jgi:hypothetical protein